MNSKEKAEFIPFHAINEFMRNDFRLQVIRSVLQSLPELNQETASTIDRLTRKHVKVSGFRNSSKAPATVKAVAMIKAFQKQPELVTAILQAWANSKPELEKDIYDLLSTRGWKILPIDADRSKLPGFLTRWPDGEDYETLYEAFQESQPDNEFSIDETSLMVVFLSGRLPIEKVNIAELTEFEEPDSLSTEDVE